MNQESNRREAEIKRGSETSSLSRSHSTTGQRRRRRRKQRRRDLGGRGGKEGGDEASNESVVLNWKDNAISVRLSVSAEDLTVNRV